MCYFYLVSDREEAVSLGKRIANLRRKAGLSQAALANRLGISAGAIGMYEHGRREPPLDIIVKLSAIFEVTTDYLLTGEIRSDQDLSMILDNKWDRYLLLVAALLADKYKES
jgi:transcriptional regulator with XRE-family HTH domain